jgi:hypothetical protein
MSMGHAPWRTGRSSAAGESHGDGIHAENPEVLRSGRVGRKKDSLAPQPMYKVPPHCRGHFMVSALSTGIENPKSRPAMAAGLDIVKSIYRRANVSRWSFYVLGLSGFLIEAFYRAHNGLFGLRGPDQYWAFEWAQDYSAGFVRRGLLGELFRRGGLENSNYLYITICAWLVSLCLILVLIKGLRQLSGNLSIKDGSLMMICAIMAPATGGLIAETTGDPLQLLLLIFFVLLIALNYTKTAHLCTGLGFLVFGVFASLVHEASIFFIFPALLIFAFVYSRSSSARAALYGYFLGSVAGVALVVLATQQAPLSDAPITLHLGSLSLAMPSSEFSSFSALLNIEIEYNFGRGASGILFMLKRLLGTLAIPLLLTCLVTSMSFGGENGIQERRTVLLAFGGLIVMSLPVYIIAHDWGRFGGYSFMVWLSLVSNVKTHEQKPDIDRTLILAACLFLAGLTTGNRGLDSYRIDGLIDDYRMLPITIFATVLVAVMFRQFWRTNLLFQRRQ